MRPLWHRSQRNAKSLGLKVVLEELQVGLDTVGRWKWNLSAASQQYLEDPRSKNETPVLNSFIQVLGVKSKPG